MKATTTSGPTISSRDQQHLLSDRPGPRQPARFRSVTGRRASCRRCRLALHAPNRLWSSRTPAATSSPSASSQVEMNSYLYNSLSPTNPTVQGGSLLNCSTLAPVNGAVSLIPVSGYLDVEGSCAFGGLVGTGLPIGRHLSRPHLSREHHLHADDVRAGERDRRLGLFVRSEMDEHLRAFRHRSRRVGQYHHLVRFRHHVRRRRRGWHRQRPRHDDRESSGSPLTP